ncbi:MAG TPA: type IV-A pilus assembly ATPase PilB [Oligoflexia bacterium]|nr:type IV-A pilus assembly ATPase PilB [Oligoflexia bacterium]HMR24155.1 type IV-A pilus assembly ATPase PilB [Oligoflexia bacterium]
MSVSQRLGELLLRKNVISGQQLQKALDVQRKSGVKLGTALTSLGFVDEDQITDLLSQQYGVKSIDLDGMDIPKDVYLSVSQEIALKYLLIPVEKKGPSLVVAMADPSNILALDELKFLTSYKIEAVVASEQSIKSAIQKHYNKEEDFEDIFRDLEGDIDDIEIIEQDEDDEQAALAEAEEAPIVKFCNMILTDAAKKGASDIHIEPYEKSFRIRFRVDGVLLEVMKPPLKLKNAIVSRLKIMSKLDIAEKRLPQDGRIKLIMKNKKEMDYRVSVLPTLFGEKVVLRLLDKSNLQLDMTKLGFETKALSDFQSAIHKPFGMVLVTGPTGSGKTTTLYSALSELNKTTENISTAEDPVEFNLEGINQVQMHDDIGLNFASALRSFLRQDPDIIMVGEIRDFETAEISVKAALTGHLVLSTLHTNDAPSTVNRLLNMGIEPFLVASSVNAILAQRLARRICSACSTENPDEDKKAMIDAGIKEEELSDFVPMRGAGCDDCNGTGYRGRVAIYEVMPIGDELKEFILNGAATSEIKKEAMRLGMKSMRQSALTKFKEGVTTVEEVLRVSVADSS